MNTKRLLALLLTLCMVFSLAVPGVAFAGDEEPPLLVEEVTPAETQDGNPVIEEQPKETTQTQDEKSVIEEQPKETTQTPGVEEIIEENKEPAETVTDEKEQPAGNTDKQQTPEQPDENGQPALASLEAQEVTQLGMGGAVASLEARDETQLGDASSVSDDETLREALETGGDITLSENIVMTKNVTIQNDVTMNLAGHAITSEKDDLFTVTNGTLTINDTVGGGSIYTYEWTALNASGGNIVVNAGKIGAKNGNTAYRTDGGSITFNGGMINQTSTSYTVGDGLTIYNGYGENKGYYIFAPETVTAVTPAAFELDVNDTQKLTATTTENVKLSWSSSDNSVASVEQDGTVTAHGTGSATIYAADDNTGSYASATVTIGDAVFKNSDSNKVYASLQVAVNEATSGDTIQLTTDTTIATVATIPEEKTLTLDLNGHTLTESTDGMRLIKNEGKLTVTGNGTITNNTNATENNSYGLIDNYGTLIIENGTYHDYGQGGGGTLRNRSTGTMTVKAGTKIEAYGTASGNATISNSGTLYIEDGVTLKNYATDDIATDGYGLYCISIYDGTTTIGTVGSNIPVNIDGNRGAIGINGGRLIINSGTFKGSIYRDLWITNDGANTAVTINGGQFIGPKESILAGIDDGNQDTSDVAVTINGGSFSKVSLDAKDSNNEWTFAIQGGSYKTAPGEKLIVTGYKVVEGTDANYPYTVVPAAVAEIGNTQYATLADAIAAVSADGSETTIKIIANQMINVVGSALTIPANKNVVLDLNGFEVVGTAAEGSTSALITNKGTLTITDSSNSSTGKLISGANPTWVYDGSDNFAGSYASNTITNSGILYVNGGHIENISSGSATYAIDNNSGASNAIATISGGTVKAKSVAIRQFANSTTNEDTVNISGGNVEAGKSAIWIQLPGSDATKAMNAALNVTGGTLKGGTYAFYDYSFGNSFTNTNYDIDAGTFIGQVFSYGANVDISGGTFEQVSIKQDKSSEVSISGGTFDYVEAYGENPSTGFITGGTFEQEPNATYIAPGYEAVALTETDAAYASGYRYVVREKPTYVAQIVGGESYATLEAAYEAASAGDTIKLLADITYGTDREVPVWYKAVNLDLGNHTLTTNSMVSIDKSNNGYKAAAICYSIPAAKAASVTVSNGTIVTAYGAGIYADDPGLTLTLSDLNIDAATVGTQSTAEYSSAIRITGGAKVIIESGTYSGYNANNAIAVSNSGGEFVISGGMFTGALYISSNCDSGKTQKISIAGGHFTADPTTYLATGYETVNSTVEGYDYTVQRTTGNVIVEAETVTQNNTQQANVKVEGVAENIATVDVSVKATDNTNIVATANTVSLSDIKVSELVEDFVKNEEITTGENTVQIAVVASNVVTDGETITMKVDPYAYVNGSSTGVKLSNALLNQNADGYKGFTFKVKAPESAQYVTVIHSWEADEEHTSAGSETFRNIPVDNGYAEVTLKHFSNLEIKSQQSGLEALGEVYDFQGRLGFDNTFTILVTTSDTSRYKPVVFFDGTEIADATSDWSDRVYIGQKTTEMQGSQSKYWRIDIKIFAYQLNKKIQIKLLDTQSEQYVYLKAYSLSGDGAVVADCSYSFADYMGYLSTAKGDTEEGAAYATLQSTMEAYATAVSNIRSYQN